MLIVYVYTAKTGDKYSSQKMVCNGDKASIKLWLSNAECSGDATITSTADAIFGSLTNDTDITLKVQCGGSICNYAKIREYDGSDQSTCQDGDYDENAFVVGDCWAGSDEMSPNSTTDSITGPSSGFSIDPDEASVKFTCDASTVSFSVWSNKQCSSNAVTTMTRVTAADKCSTVEFCSQCAQFMVYSTIFAFIASLFIQ